MLKVYAKYLRATLLIIFLLFCFCELNEAAWRSQCWRKHTAGSIQTPEGELKRPLGIICTYQCMLWFPPVYPNCEFIFDMRLTRHFNELPDCYTIRCNETFSFLGLKLDN